MNSRVYFLGFCVVLLPLRLWAGEPLTLQRVLQSVDRHYPLVVAATQEASKAEGDLLSAEGGFDAQWKTSFTARPLGYYQWQTVDSWIEKPTSIWGARVFAGYRRGEGNAPLYEQKGITNPRGEGRLGFDLPLIRNGPIDARRATVQKSEWGVEGAQNQVSQQKLDSFRSAAIRYWDWVASAQKLKIYQSLLEIAQFRDAAMVQRVRQGDLPSIDQLDNQRSVLQREQQVVSGQRSFQKASLELSLFHRNESGQVVLPTLDQMPEQIPEIPRAVREFGKESDILQWSNAHPEVRRLSILKQQNEVDLRWAKNQILPKLDFWFQTSKDLGWQYKEKSPWELETGLVLEIPLETRTQRGRIQGLSVSAIRLDVTEQLARDRVLNQLQDARQMIVAALERSRMAKEEYELARKVEDGERKRFDQGDSNIIFVNQREQNAAEAAIRWVDAQVDCQKAWADFKAAQGRWEISDPES